LDALFDAIILLPMIYMPDCISAAIGLMDADLSRLRHHNGFNVPAMSFSAGELATEIAKRVPHLSVALNLMSGRRLPILGHRVSTIPCPDRSSVGSRSTVLQK